METLPGIQARVPLAAEHLHAALRNDRAARLPSLLAATQAVAYLATQGYAVPSCDEVISNLPAPHARHDETISCTDGSAEPPTPAISARSRRTLLTCPPASRALLFSQAGPPAARAFTALPTSDDVAIPDSQFRVLLLRRLHLTLPLGPQLHI